MYKIAISPGKIISAMASRVNAIKTAPPLTSGYLAQKTTAQLGRMNNMLGLSNRLGSSWNGYYITLPWQDPLKGSALRGLRTQRTAVGRDLQKHVFKNPNIRDYRERMHKVLWNNYDKGNYAAVDKLVKSDYYGSSFKNKPSSTWNVHDWRAGKTAEYIPRGNRSGIPYEKVCNRGIE